jgi:hypothetical protein
MVSRPGVPVKRRAGVGGSVSRINRCASIAPARRSDEDSKGSAPVTSS